jgi:DNA-binding transcriptional ArsR family regulator
MERQLAVAALAALAQESRLDVFRLLVRAGSEGATPSEIARELGIAPPTLSFHLKELKGAGLVRVRREGRSLHYAPDFAAMRSLVAYLTEHCCQGAAAGAARRRRT